jgi:hypothetical protein
MGRQGAPGTSAPAAHQGGAAEPGMPSSRALDYVSGPSRWARQNEKTAEPVVMFASPVTPFAKHGAHRGGARAQEKEAAL